MAQWVDFKTLRQQLSFQQVLQFYEIEVKAKGQQHHGFCPLPNHGGNKNSPSFSASLEKGIFQCFGCGAKGNVLDFAVLMDGGKPENPQDVRKSALKLQEKFGLRTEKIPSESKGKPRPPADRKSGTVLVNAKLDFELKTLDYEHPYLRTRGFTEATIREFGLGYCSRGYLAGRVAIPLHDQLGRIVGYAGRIVDDSLIDEEHPRYRFPGERTHKGITYEFSKSEFLYGGYRIKEPTDDLTVVEGFPSVWWFHQYSIPSVVALMGWSCSDKQAELIASLTKPRGRVLLMSDGDESGNRCADSLLAKVALHRCVRWIKLRDGAQPTDFSGDEIRDFLRR